MKYQMMTVAFSTLIGTAPIFADVLVTSPELTAGEVERLQAGEILISTQTTDGTNKAEMHALVKAPIEELIAAASDFSQVDQWTVHITEPQVADLVEYDQGKRFVCSGVTPMPFPLKKRSWSAQCHYRFKDKDGQRVYIAEWEYIPGSGNIKDSYGYWYFTPYGDGSATLIKYQINANTGAPLPDFVIDWATRTMLPKAIKGLERHCECVAEGDRH